MKTDLKFLHTSRNGLSGIVELLDEPTATTIYILVVIVSSKSSTTFVIDNQEATNVELCGNNTNSAAFVVPYDSKMSSATSIELSILNHREYNRIQEFLQTHGTVVDRNTWKIKKSTLMLPL
jgi:hypothetical protein